MSRVQNKKNKLVLLQAIAEKKSILFGSFQNNASTKTKKEDAWKEILIKAQSLGLAGTNREWTYARDNLFGLWKSRTLLKRDNARKTGTGGGKDVVLDELDNIILDIIGKESPVVCGLSLPETDGVQVNKEIEKNIETLEKKKPCNKRNLKRAADDEIEILKKAVLESELHKNKLIIFDIEKRMGLKRSKFTEEFEEYQKDKNESNDSATSSVTHTLLFEDF